MLSILDTGIQFFSTICFWISPKFVEMMHLKSLLYKISSLKCRDSNVQYCIILCNTLGHLCLMTHHLLNKEAEKSFLIWPWQWVPLLSKDVSLFSCIDDFTRYLWNNHCINFYPFLTENDLIIKYFDQRYSKMKKKV